MAKEVQWPFPIKGYDANWAYSDQPPFTTPSASNVRGYSADSERARGGSRPGIKQAYSQQVGDTSNPIQWVGWLDKGFGDTVLYKDLFAYTNGALSGQTAWTGDTEVVVKNGYVHLNSMVTDKAVTYASFASDDWQDFTLECDLAWNWGSTGSISLWVSSASDAGTDGAKVTVSFTSTEIPSPGLGFSSVVQIDLASGANTDKYTASYGMLMSVRGSNLIIKATKDRVTVNWLGAEVASVARDDGTCDQAGFKMTMSNPVTAAWWPDTLVDFRIMDWLLTAVTRPTTLARELVTVSNRTIWAESAEGTMGSSYVDSNQLTSGISLISAAYCNGNLFFLDGTQPLWYNPMAASDSVVTWSARKGKIVNTCRGIVNWRNRVVLFNSVEDPQNYYMSRLGDPWDWDYGKMDAESAVAGNQTMNGRIGDPIKAMCPISDDVLIIGCTRSVWAMYGDPMAGGYVTRLSDQTGIVGQNAWTTDPQGNLYFMGEEGLFVLPPRGKPQNLTRHRIPSLGSHDPVMTGTTGSAGEYYVTLAYDADRHGVVIFQTPYSTGTAEHYFYDIRTDAFWPEAYPTTVGPTCAAFYNAAGPTYRKLLLGGTNGYLYEYSDSQNYDLPTTGGTTAISSYVWYTPRQFGGPIRDAIVTKVVGTLSSGSESTIFGVYAADVPETLTGMSSGVVGSSGNWTAGLNYADRTRVRGGAHSIKVSNATADQGWAVENVTVEVFPGGELRK